jgi:hypothetical protein
MILTFQVVKRMWHLSPLALNEKLESDAPAKFVRVSAGRGAKKSNLCFFVVGTVAGQLALESHDNPWIIR